MGSELSLIFILEHLATIIEIDDCRDIGFLVTPKGLQHRNDLQRHLKPKPERYRETAYEASFWG